VERSKCKGETTINGKEYVLVKDVFLSHEGETGSGGKKKITKKEEEQFGVSEEYALRGGRRKGEVEETEIAWRPTAHVQRGQSYLETAGIVERD